MVECRFNAQVKIIRTDNGLEFTNNETFVFPQSKLSCIRKPAHILPKNGIVERKHTYLLGQLDPNVKIKEKEGVPFSDLGYYRKLVGKLNFLTHTRFDIAYGV